MRWYAVTTAVLLLAASGSPADVPGAEPAPFPDIPTLLREVEQNQEKLEKAQEDYTYTRTDTDLETDGKGHAREKAVRTYEVIYVEGRPVEKLVARNGRPLAPEDARKEQEKVEKAIREQRKKAAEEKDRQQKGQKNEDEMTVSEILRVCRFVNPRRQSFRGKETLRLDFEARPGARPSRRIEAWIQKLVGTVWIDEQVKGILRLEGRVNDSIKMGGGLLVSLHRGSSFVFEQELVQGEVWLPSFAEVHASARFLLVKGFKIDQTQRFSDYRKFSVDTSSEVKPPTP